MIDRIVAGDKREANVALLRDLCDTMLDGSLCALGGLTPYPVLSALDHFPEDFQRAASGRLRNERLTMAFRTELDTGTPIRVAEEQVTLTIDGRAVSVPKGTSVMAAAALLQAPIPKLCATDSLEAFGSCRLCLVEIEGRRGTPASCTTPAESGMVVRTQTDKLAKLRRGVMELYISDHPLDCLTCSANGDCELQTQAGVVGLRDVRYGYDGANHMKAPKDESNPYFTFEASKCIVCSRCVRACEEIQGTFALTVAGARLRLQDFGRAASISCRANASPAAPACRPARPRR